MNKQFLSILFYCIIPILSEAQCDQQTSILTDDGIFTISKTNDGKDLIFFNNALWDDMVRGTKYISANLSVAQTVTIYIEISNRKQMHCKTGVGFRCGIFDAFDVKKNSAIVDHTNRICTAMLQKQDKFTVKIIFLDEVNWYSLQTNQ